MCSINFGAQTLKHGTVKPQLFLMEKHRLGSGTSLLSVVAGWNPSKDKSEFTCSALCCVLFQ